MRCRISVRMLTTMGDCAFATLRNVCASSAPVIGALFSAGRARPCAADDDVRSRREAMTSATANDEHGDQQHIENGGFAR